MLQPQMMENFIQTARFIFVPTNEEEFERLNSILDEVTDIVRDDETHPLVNLMDVLGVLIETYENKHILELKGDGVTVLKHFMREYDLKQGDLSELGSQGVVSEIINGKRKLNLRQIRMLSRRFNVSPSVFI